MSRESRPSPFSPHDRFAQAALSIGRSVEAHDQLFGQRLRHHVVAAVLKMPNVFV